jgi:hypothetical protein
MKRNLEDADTERKALIQKIAEFLYKVIPKSTTYAGQQVPPATPQVHTSEADTASPALPFMSRTRESMFASPGIDSDEESAGASYVPGESTVQAFSAQHFGTVASPYVAAYAFRTGILDSEFGMRRDADGTFRIGNAAVVIDQDSNVNIKGKTYTGTRGLFELLTRKKVDKTFITDSDLQTYKAILEATHGHLENNDPSGVLKTTRGIKFRDVISKLFPTGTQGTSRQRWAHYK